VGADLRVGRLPKTCSQLLHESAQGRAGGGGLGSPLFSRVGGRGKVGGVLSLERGDSPRVGEERKIRRRTGFNFSSIKNREGGKL
jgi:hypothetical protein